MLFSFVDDDCFRVVTNVDNIVQVAVGIVKGVTELLMELRFENLLRVVI